jgi:cytochrome P450
MVVTQSTGSAMSDDRTAPVAELAAKFDHNDHAMRRECAQVYATLRDSCPVFHSDRWGGFWVASRYEDVYEVGRDPERFASGEGVLVPPMGHGRPLKPMEADAPEHSAYRRLLLPSFAPAQVAQMEADVRALAVALVDEVVADGSADLYEMLAKPLPLLMITLLLGIEKDAMFWEATDTLMYGRLSGVGEAAILEAADHLYAFMERQIDRRRAEPGDDLVSLMLTGTVDGRPYTDDEVLDLCCFMLVAGLENTAFGIRATLRHLAVHPEHLAEVVADPSKVTNLVEQSLRLYAPVTALARTVTRDTEVAGQQLRAGERILLLFGSANRDAAVFDDPDTFHLDRRDGRHLAFGIGPHRCIGSHLARLEVRIAVEEFIRRVPEFKLADGPDPGWYQAGPLHVVWPVPPTSQVAS